MTVNLAAEFAVLVQYVLAIYEEHDIERASRVRSAVASAMRQVEDSVRREVGEANKRADAAFEAAAMLWKREFSIIDSRPVTRPRHNGDHQRVEFNVPSGYAQIEGLRALLIAPRHKEDPELLERASVMLAEEYQRLLKEQKP